MSSVRRALPAIVFSFVVVASSTLSFQQTPGITPMLRLAVLAGSMTLLFLLFVMTQVGDKKRIARTRFENIQFVVLCVVVPLVITFLLLRLILSIYLRE
jgi:hypothetical protein